MPRFTVVTILPELIEPALTAGVVGRAKEAGTIVVDTVNPRDFTHDKHRTVDDTPYGGGPGMVMKAEPLLAAIAAASVPAPAADDAGPARTDGDEDAQSFGKQARSLGKRVLRSVESTLTKLASPKPAEVDDGAHAGEIAEAAAYDAEATIAQLEAELRGEFAPAGAGVKPSAGAAKRPAAAGAGTPAAGPGASSTNRPAAGRYDAGDADEENRAAEALLADLEGELGMRTVSEDLRVGSRGAEAKILGPAIDDEPAPISGSGPGSGSGWGSGSGSASGSASGSGSGSASESASGSGSGSASASDSGSGSGSAARSGSESSGSATGAATATTSRAHRILMSPSGAPLTQARVRELAKLDHIVLVCGRYEGIDQRVIDAAIDEEISIGDYVLSGGELAALVVVDAVARLIPGVLGEPTSADDESFSAGLLEYPQYTRPPVLDAKHIALVRDGREAAPSAETSSGASSSSSAVQQGAGVPVPAVLQSGNHALIASWRRQQAIERTAQRRPDLFRRVRTTKADRKLYAPLRARTHIALVHHPVVDRNDTVITTAVTNFDIHDIARSTMTYGLANYHLVTPVTSQREKAAHIAELWMGDEQGEHRAQALRLVRTAASVDEVIATITVDAREPPTVVATSARSTSFPSAARRTSEQLVAEATLDTAPLLLLLGTGWGLADSLIPSVSRVLAPIEGDSDWNHLSVRSAAAIILDRLFGRPA